MKTIRLVLACIILLLAFFNFANRPDRISAASIDSQSLMEKINKERTSRAIPALLTSPKLSKAAALKTGDMFARGYFDHIDPDGKYVWPLIEAQGYKPYSRLGENLAIDFSTEDGIVRAWINSPTHRDNLLRAEFADQGLDSQYGNYQNRYTAIVTSLFGTLLQPAEKTAAPVAQSKSATPQVKSGATPKAAEPPALVKNAQPPTPVSQQTAPVAEEPKVAQPKNEPAVALFLGGGDIQKEAKQESSATESASDVYRMSRTIFIILIILLLAATVKDGFANIQAKGLWDKNHYPIFFILLLTCLLTLSVY